MFAIVNGYPCTSTCDVAVARRNTDPRNPRNDPVKAEQLAEADALKGKDVLKGNADPTRVNAAQQSTAAGLTPKRLVDFYA